MTQLSFHTAVIHTKESKYLELSTKINAAFVCVVLSRKMKYIYCNKEFQDYVQFLKYTGIRHTYRDSTVLFWRRKTPKRLQKEASVDFNDK